VEVELVLDRGGRDLLRVRVERAETYVGKHPANDVVVPDDRLADVAALLLDRGAQRFQLRMLDGSPLVVGGVELDADAADLRLGDAFQLGDYTARLERKVERTPNAALKQTRAMVAGGAPSAVGDGVLVHRGQRLAMPRDRPFNIGTDDDNDLVLEDPFVSSFHCRVLRRDDRWTLVDLASTNGTFVGGLRVGEAELPTRAHIMIGGEELLFEREAGPAQAETAVVGELFHGMLTASPLLQRAFAQIRKLADARAPVLVLGPSGAGKELVARALHEESGLRRRGPYLALNCGAFAQGMIEAELFGHVKGAFTGADRDKKGAFEAAAGGTLFLDELGELPLELQPKLLRVLESSAVRRLGGTQEIPVDTRIVAATLRDLDELVRKGKFREDLYHRLHVVTIQVPPLAERPEDVLPLARHFIAEQSPPGRDIHLTDEAVAALRAHAWPGNVRELRNVIVRAILLGDGDVIEVADLQLARAAREARPAERVSPRVLVAKADEDEKSRILRALALANDNRAEAARLLGLSKSTFHDRLRRLGLPLKNERGAPE
jgi:DNA-binding NtrC family response regulator